MDTIKFKVIADDSVLQSSAIVLELVGDSNDNAPRFTGTPFQGTLLSPQLQEYLSCKLLLRMM